MADPVALGRLLELLAHRKTGDAVNDAVVDAIAGGFAEAFDRLALVAFEGEGSHALRDPRIAPVWALAHAAMYVGAELPRREADETLESWLARARDLAVYPLGIKRGTHEAIRRTVRPYLTGSKFVAIEDNAGGDPYALLVRTAASETPDPEAVRVALEGDFVSSGRRGAIRAELVLQYVVSDLVTFPEAELTFDAVEPSVTFDAVTLEDIT